MRVYQFRHVGICNFNHQRMVPTKGLEPLHLAAHGPEPCASTNSATWALMSCCYFLLRVLQQKARILRGGDTTVNSILLLL
jgi:hypothetical protein